MFCHTERLRDRPPRLNLVLSDSARLQIDDPTLVSYSTRHTMKDKMRTIRATAELQHSILGHGKRTIADDYGEGELLRYLLEELIKADGLSHWGN